MAAEPKILGHYRIERTLGKGAMGVVYEGLDMRLHRKVAIKTIIKAEQGDTMAQEYSSRFLREAQAVARLNHPNIVHVYDFGEEDDISFIVMEYINGRDLKSVFEAKDRFELKENLRLICELLDGLDFAHNAGVVHRDIKPANLMIDSQRRLKLTDFGVARLTDVERTRVELTQAGTMVGTPAYMSPEQVQGGQIDHRTDIFSAGVVLYQMLTGQKPFEGGAFTVAKRIVESEPPPPSSIERSLSPELDRIVARALAKLPEQRYSRAREFAQALRRAFDVRSVVDPDEETIMAPAPAASTMASSPRAFDSPSTTAPRQAQSTAPSAEADLEFWRTIKDSTDADDMEFYVQKFPNGIYVDLAKRKITRLRGASAVHAADESSVRGRNLDEEFWRGVRDSNDPDEMEMYLERFPQGLYVDLAKRRVARMRRGSSGDEDSGMRGRNLDEELWRGVRDSTDPADIEHYLERFPQGPYVELAKRRLAQGRREGPDEDSGASLKAAEALKSDNQDNAARRQAPDKAHHETAKREAEDKARREAEERAKRDAEAKREAEERAKRDAAEKAKRDAEAEAKREADERAAKAMAKLEAWEKTRREGEEKAQREATERTRLEAEEKARQHAHAAEPGG